MKKITISKEEFKERLKDDPRIKDEYINRIELPLAFAAGNKFLKNYILDKSEFKPDSDLPSDWFQFSQLLEEFEVNKEELMIKYDEEKDTHPSCLEPQGYEYFINSENLLEAR